MANRLRLMVPPSTNSLFASVGNRRVKTRNYRDWIELSEYQICKQSPVSKIIAVIPYSVSIAVNVNRRRDIDNIAKPVLDLLVAKRIVVDDRYCDLLEIRRVSGGVSKNHLSVSWQSLDENVRVYDF